MTRRSTGREPPSAARLFPSPSARLRPRDIHRDLALTEGSPGETPYTVVNAVGTLDGRASLGGMSTPLGGAADRLVMRNIRCAVDAVLVGAGTLRRENLGLGVPEQLVERRRRHGLADQPLQVVLKGLAPLPRDRRLYESAGDRLVVLSTHRGNTEKDGIPPAAHSREVPSAPGAAWPDAKGVLGVLAAEFGVRRLLVEGGPRVNRSFLEGGYVRELFFTLAPNVTGEHDHESIVAGGPRLPDAAPGWRLVSIHIDAESNLFLRYTDSKHA